MEQRHCARCGSPVELRTARSGRKYYVNAAGAPGPLGQFHSVSCPGKQAKPKLDAPDAPRNPVYEELEATPEAKAEPAPVPKLENGLAKFVELIAAHVAVALPKQSVDAEQVKAMVKAEILEQGGGRVTVTVQNGDKPPVDCGRQHKQFPTLLQIISRRRNVWMAGPAGSGKTRAAHEAANSLGLSFGAVSVGPQTTQSLIFGYMDAHGNYVHTEFRRRYEHGGVFLFDEIDRGNPGVLTALNQAIENGTCAFPDAMIARHPDFVAIAAANTYGTGASREYVGALQLDAATLDRFVMLSWDYDEALEQDIAEATFKASGGTDMMVLANWLAKVRRARSQAAALKLRHVVSPRASIVGAELLAIGMDANTVAFVALWKGADADAIARMS